MSPGVGQLSDNTPPVMHIDRDWLISDAEPVGSVVTRVRASDAEGDALKFGLEPLLLYPHPQGEPPPPLPFEIDEDSGVVHTNASLKDRVRRSRADEGLRGDSLGGGRGTRCFGGENAIYYRKQVQNFRVLF